MAFNLAKDRPLGGGFDSFQPMMFAMYAPDPDNVHDSHSIYFEVLGEHGFIGLGLFLVLGLMTWRTASEVIRRARDDPGRRWAADLAAMVQVSLVGYASAGAFLGLAYFDFYYTLIAVVVLCKIVISRETDVKRVGAADIARRRLVPQGVTTQRAGRALAGNASAGEAEGA
jgi:probable O-glycosylation ligase (exosortase A-associated)